MADSILTNLTPKTTPVGADSLYLNDSQNTTQNAAGSSASLTLGNLTTNYLSSATQTFTNKTFDTAGAGNVLKINGTQVSAVTGTGSAVLATSPTLVTPVLGVATATSLNKVTVTAPTTAATLVFGTDNATITFQGTDTYVGRATSDTLTNKTLTSPVINVTSDAQGDVYYRNGSGNFARLAPGTNGQFLQTQGASANPQWAASINFATSGPQADTNTSSTSFVDVTGVTLTINPTRTVTVHAVISGDFYDVTGSAGDNGIQMLIDGVVIQSYSWRATLRTPFCLTGQASVASGARIIKVQYKANSGDTIHVDQANINVIWG